MCFRNCLPFSRLLPYPLRLHLIEEICHPVYMCKRDPELNLPCPKWPSWALLRHLLALILVITSISCASQNDAAFEFGEPLDLSSEMGEGVSPNIAISGSGNRAIAWVVANESGSNGDLAVAVNGERPVVIHDVLGQVQAHEEAPPQLVFANDSTIHILYVVTKDVGRRFPVSALRAVRSHNKGATWSAPVTVTDDTLVFGSPNFHSLSIGEDATLYASWLDGRSGQASTYMTASRDGGETWKENSRVSSGESCPCCRTSVAGGANGKVYVAWRAVLEGGIRDIVVAASDDYGRTFKPPVRVFADNWEFSGCPHAGPSLKIDRQGSVHILWWTGQPKGGGVFYSRSDDGADTFAPPVTIHHQPIPIPTHVQLALFPDRRVLTVWDDLHAEPSRIVMRISEDRGQTFGRVHQISEGSEAAQHPVVEMDSSSAQIAWVEKGTRRTVFLRELLFIPR